MLIARWGGRSGCASSPDRAGGHDDSRSYLLAQECVTGPSRALGNPIRAPSSPSSYVTSTASMPGGGAGVRSAGFCVSAPRRFFALSIRTAHSASTRPHGADLFAASRAASEIKAPSLGRGCVPMWLSPQVTHFAFGRTGNSECLVRRAPRNVSGISRVPPQPAQRTTGASGSCRVIVERTSRRIRRFPCEGEYAVARGAAPLVAPSVPWTHSLRGRTHGRSGR